MNICIKFLITSSLALSSPVSQAYKIATHDDLSKKTALCSVLGQDTFIKSIGWASILETDDDDFKYKRPNLLQKTGSTLDLTTQGLIGWGTQFEDELKPIKRPVNHFFNPLTSKGSLLPSSKPSPDWALEDKGINFLQKFSFMDANQMLSDAASRVSKSQRKEKWGDFFQTLGMVLHHIQDMSQPQHVRLDNHCDGKLEGVECYGIHNPSYYESFTNENRKLALSGIGCNSYPQLSLKRFSNARDFWLTDDGNGIGIAEYTNRNFVSDETNFRRNLATNNVISNRKYPNPKPIMNGGKAKITKIDIQELIRTDKSQPPLDTTLSGEVWFYETLVQDNYLISESSINERASSASLWTDKFDRFNFKFRRFGLTTKFPVREFNLNRFNFLAGYPFLFPRAITYGAGLINYFFRGRLEVKNVLYTAGVSLAFTVKNTTSKENPGNAPFSFTAGSFNLYYDDRAGNRYRITSTASDQSAMIFSGGKIFADKDDFDVSFDLSGINNIDITKPFSLVFTGNIGSPKQLQTTWELGTAVKTFSPQRLLAFDVSRSDSTAPVPNIIDIYQSLDTGKSWQKVSGIPVAVSDITPAPGDRLAVNAVTYIGNGSLLLYPDYIDYSLSTSVPTEIRFTPLRIAEYGQQTRSAIALDLKATIAGYRNNVSDIKKSLRSLTFTGNNSLAALRIKHPLPSDPTPRSRQFQLMYILDWKTKPTYWRSKGIWGVGGLPELSWQGGNNYVTNVSVEKKETADPNTLGTDSAIRRTADRGASYLNLTNFDECVRSTSKPDLSCVQRIIPLDNNRLLGWVSQYGDDYFANDDRDKVQLYLSLDNGANWSKYGIVTLPPSCAGPKSDRRYQTVDNLLYLGTKKLATGVEEDTLFAESTCRKMILVNGKYSKFEEVGKTVSVTTNSATKWVEMVNPPHKNGRIIFAGDNGVVPGLFE